MIKNGQYGKFCVVTQLDSTKTIHVSAVALLDTDVCLAVEGCLCGVVVGLALVDTDVCLAAEAWLFGEVAAVALFQRFAHYFRDINFESAIFFTH